MDDIQFMVIDTDGWGRVNILSHDPCFLQANGKPEGIAEASHELLWVVCKEEVKQASQLDFSLGF